MTCDLLVMNEVIETEWNGIRPSHIHIYIQSKHFTLLYKKNIFK